MLALMGHMSRSMLERYSHIRLAAKREAISGITLRPKAAAVVENSEAVPGKSLYLGGLSRSSDGDLFVGH
jgi:hypothetical protein